jgi:hypothetical protein
MMAEPAPSETNNDHNGHGPTRLRDRLLLLIRQHQLDSEQVKQYAVHFCGAETLREASREQVENLVNHLTILAAQGRDQLLAELNSFGSKDSCPATGTDTSARDAAGRKEAA